MGWDGASIRAFIVTLEARTWNSVNDELRKLPVYGFVHCTNSRLVSRVESTIPG